MKKCNLHYLFPDVRINRGSYKMLGSFSHRCDIFFMYSLIVLLLNVVSECVPIVIAAETVSAAVSKHSTADNKHYYVINLVSSVKPVAHLRATMAEEYQGYVVYVSKFNRRGQVWNRLRLGFFQRHSAAKMMLDKLKNKYPKAWVVRVSSSELTANNETQDKTKTKRQTKKADSALQSVAQGSVTEDENVVWEPVDGIENQFDCIVEPSEEVDVGAEMPGLLGDILVDRGDYIEADTVVAKLQTALQSIIVNTAKQKANSDIQIEMANERMVFSERKYKRALKLRDGSYISEDDVDQAKSEINLANLAYKEALENKKLAQLNYEREQEVLELRSIRSPISGVVVDRYFSKGEYVEDKPILKIAKINPLNVEVVLPIEMLNRVKLDQRVHVRLETDKEFKNVAKVTVIDRVIDASSGTYGVRLELPNPNRKIFAGLKCTVAF